MADEPKKSFVHHEDVLTMLNRDLANEMNTMLMYMADGYLAKGTDSLDVKEITKKFAKQDFRHAQKLAARIVELDGVPQLMPTNIDNNTRLDFKTHSDGAVLPILKDALECELQSVLEIKNQVQTVGLEDPATCLLLEKVLSDKEHQVEEIRDLLGI